MTTIGENIKMIRKASNETQARFAERVGISRSYLGDLENNRKSPSLETIEKLANNLGVPVSRLTEGHKTITELFNDHLKNDDDFINFKNTLNDYFNTKDDSPNLNKHETERSFMNNKITLVEDIDKQYTQIESDIDESLTLIKTETDEEKIRDFSSQISQGSQVLEHLEEVKLKLISNPEFKFYVHNKVIYLIVNKEELTVDDVKFNASQYDNLIVRKNGEEIVHLTDFDNAVLIDTIKEYHDWNTSIILTINAWFKMIDYTQHI